MNGDGEIVDALLHHRQNGSPDSALAPLKRLRVGGTTMATAKQDEPKHYFGCPTQGLPKAFLPEAEIRKWLERELALWGGQEWPPLYIERLGQYDPILVSRYAGATPLDMLEHNTRRVALDPLLEALGWSFRDRTEEARVAGDTTLFIDYLGIDQETRSAELIFEAKAWNASWLAGKGDAYRGRPAAELVAAAVDHLNGGAPKSAPLTDEWIKRITQLRDYVVGIEANGGAIVQRAVIGCARWIIIFKDPGAAFIRKTITGEDVLALELAEMVERSDEIFGLLSIDALKVAPRMPIHPDEIALYIRNPADIRRVFRALYVNRANTTDQFAPQPSIYVNPWLIVERSDGALIEIRPREQPDILPPGKSFLEMHLDEVAVRSNKMLVELSAVYGVPLPMASRIGDFPNFATSQGPTPVRRSTAKAGNFLVVTGENPRSIGGADLRLERPNRGQA